MKIYLLIIVAFFAVLQSSAQCKLTVPKKVYKAEVNEQVKFKNLPDGAKLDDEVRINKYNDDGELVSSEIITVEQKLNRLGAKYFDGKLVGKNGKEIRFYKAPVRGTSQGFEQDRKQAETDAKELEDLKEKFTVIEIYVNRLKFM